MSDNTGRRKKKQKSHNEDENLPRHSRSVDNSRLAQTESHATSPVPSCSYTVAPNPQRSRQPCTNSSGNSSGEQLSRQLMLPTSAPWIQSSQSNAQELRPYKPHSRKRKRSARSRRSKTEKKLISIAKQLRELQCNIESYAAQMIEFPPESSSDDTSTNEQEAGWQSFIQEEAQQENQPDAEDEYSENRSAQEVEMQGGSQMLYSAGHKSYKLKGLGLELHYTRNETLTVISDLAAQQETSGLQRQPEPLEPRQHQEAPRLMQQPQQDQFFPIQTPPWLDQRHVAAEPTRQHSPYLLVQNPVNSELMHEPKLEHELSETEEERGPKRPFWHIPQNEQFEPEQRQQLSYEQRFQLNEPQQPLWSENEQSLQSLSHEQWMHSLNANQLLHQFNNQQWLQSMNYWDQIQPCDGHVHLPSMSDGQWMYSLNQSSSYHVQPLTPWHQLLPFIPEQQLLRHESSAQPLSQLTSSLPEYQVGQASYNPRSLQRYSLPHYHNEQHGNLPQHVAIDLSRVDPMANRPSEPNRSESSPENDT